MTNLKKVQVDKAATRIDRVSLGSDGCAPAGAFFIPNIIGPLPYAISHIIFKYFSIGYYP